jgi:Icc-related predicted phosphoesterase
MQILASADMHGDLDIYQWLVGVAVNTKPDVLVIAGDLLGAPDVFGTIEEDQRANALEILKIISRVKQPILYLMGNDDTIELEPHTDSIQSVNDSRIEFGGLSFVGYQYSLPFMGGIFEKSEDGIRDDLSSLYPLVDNRTVLVTHSPAYGILDIGILGLPVGSISIKELVEDRNPLLHIHGHIHQEFGVRGRHFNVAAAGHKRAVLIDTETLEYQVVSEEPV